MSRMSLREEVARLRSFPRNTLSFTHINGRGQSVFHLPPLVEGDFCVNHATGTRMALELIRAMRADERGNSLMYLVQKMAPLWEDTTMRNAFFGTLELAIMESPHPEAQADNESSRQHCMCHMPLAPEVLA